MQKTKKEKVQKIIWHLKKQTFETKEMEQKMSIAEEYSGGEDLVYAVISGRAPVKTQSGHVVQCSK